MSVYFTYREIYYDLKEKYPVRSSGCNQETIDELQHLLTEAKFRNLKDQTEYWASKVIALEKLLAEHQTQYNLYDCGTIKEIKTIEEINDLIEKETKEYNKDVTAQNKKNKAVILIIGAGIIVVGTLMILLSGKKK